MKPASGEYRVGLDQLRALAVGLVFFWHVSHVTILPFGTVYPLFLSPLIEGHCGVSLFMTLSGYLYFKILDGKKVNFLNFFISRSMRLFPLLFIVIIAHYWLSPSQTLLAYAAQMMSGFILPVWPNGGWSVAIEFQFYFLVPVLLSLHKSDRRVLPVLVLTFVLLRSAYWLLSGEVQFLSYLTLCGRIDQFIAGIIVASLPVRLKYDRVAITLAASIFFIMYGWLNHSGGFYNTEKSPIWIILPTVEAFFFSALIRWYDNVSFSLGKYAQLVGSYIAMTGACSYSLYLFHPFIMLSLGNIMGDMAGRSHSVYVALILSLLSMGVLVPVAWLSFRYIEQPPLRFRPKYHAPKPSRR